jgi:NADPH2:quinone reductase
MRALLMQEHGALEKLTLADVPMPECRPDDVVIRVAAAGVNPVDWKEVTGLLARYYGYYTGSWVPGYDAAGIVHEVGANVRDFAVGDRVVAFSDRRENGHNGTFADFVRVLSSVVCKLPDAVDFLSAAALPVAGLTAYQALYRADKGGLRSGDFVLIHGASGGVGSWGVQLAKALGLRVAGTCGSRNVEYVRSLGADLVVDYTQQNIFDAVKQWSPGGVHGIVDAVGVGTLRRGLDLLQPNGRWVCIMTSAVSEEMKEEAREAERRGMRKLHTIMNFDRINQEFEEVLAFMSEDKIRVRPLVIYPLREARMALQHVMEFGSRGKVVLTMPDLDFSSMVMA